MKTKRISHGYLKQRRIWKNGIERLPAANNREKSTADHVVTDQTSCSHVMVKGAAGRFAVARIHVWHGIFREERRQNVKTGSVQIAKAEIGFQRVVLAL